MINPELKKKIVNTINTYELKCDALKQQINTYKNVITQLILTSNGLNREMDEDLSHFQKQLDDQFDQVAVEKKGSMVVNNLIKLEKRRTEKARKISRLIKQSTESIGRIANKSQDKRAVGKLEKMLKEDIDNDAILVNFNEVLTQCVSSVVKDLDELQTIKLKTSKNATKAVVNDKINESLHQLLNHLPISKKLQSKIKNIEEALEKKLSTEGMSDLIDNLTQLVIDSFDIEQNRIKKFLQQLTNQLQDFDQFFKSTSDHNKQSSKNSLKLENGIQDNINEIKNHLDTSTTIEELASKLTENLDNIGMSIRDYRENEAKRGKKLEEQVKVLQQKLMDSEKDAEEIKNLISYQRHRINHDSLTSLPNRYSYEEHISEAFARWKRSGKKMSLAFCDIDHFKKINDSFGHLAGDKVLKKVAELLRSSLRITDFIARVGGEEFVIIFEETNSSTAATILEKLRKIIEECQFYYRESKVDVTVSFGLASIMESDDVESLYMRADSAMYQAKHSGRNRVESI